VAGERAFCLPEYRYFAVCVWTTFCRSGDIVWDLYETQWEAPSLGLVLGFRFLVGIVPVLSQFEGLDWVGASNWAVARDRFGAVAICTFGSEEREWFQQCIRTLL
jgi:hypothetical protein